MRAVNWVVENQGEFVGAFRENVIRVIGSYSTKDVATEYDGQVEELQQQLMGLIEENARQGAVDENFDERYREISEEIRGLKVKKLKMVQEQKLAVGYDQRLEDMDRSLKRVSSEVKTFDEDLIRRLLERIKVINERKIEVHFKSGIVMDQRIDYYED